MCNNTYCLEGFQKIRACPSHKPWFSVQRKFQRSNSSKKFLDCNEEELPMKDSTEEEIMKNKNKKLCHLNTMRLAICIILNYE
jgi:hypothetical protein